MVCADLTLMLFRAPDDKARNDTLMMQSMFSDGAGVVVVGADPVAGEAQAKFELVSASQVMAPAGKLEGGVGLGQLRQSGLLFHPSRSIPAVIHENLERPVDV